MKTYLAITIGPIYRTIERAKKTRELWAASFLLSQLMRILLGKVKKYGTPLSPDLSRLDTPEKYHGAGIWNDNCYFSVHPGMEDDLRAALPGIIGQAKQELLNLILIDWANDKDKPATGLSESDLRDILARHFHAHAVLIKHESTPQQPVLKALSAHTASAELRDRFPAQYDDAVSKALFRGKAIRDLYHLGFEAENEPVFTHYRNRFESDKMERRLPSLLEIGIREFRRDESLFKKIVDKISDRLQGKSDDAESEEENQAIIRLLKQKKDAKGLPLLKKRHKYVAIVQSDGDGVGNLITSEPDEGRIRAISEALMNFSVQAVKKIVAYDGLPVYAGGDDLLFMAPLRNHRGQNLFDLIRQINEVFAAQNLPEGASLSFGISIFYYKYPLGEALENGRDLLNKLAKKLVYHEGTLQGPLRKKKALAFRVMLHGGQSFASVLRQDGDTWREWTGLLAAHAGNDAAFVSGVIHSLERLGWLLQQACAMGTAEAFFEKHFNEAKNTPRWAFVEQVRTLAEAIYREYGPLDIKPADKNHFFTSQLDLPPGKYPNADYTDDKLHGMYCNNLLYSALRLIQFLNAEDHE
ncbi:MAG: type III-B CRISPR-associated protein Cas10/Cmr2 [Saprospiraceae bacterium]